MKIQAFCQNSFDALKFLMFKTWNIAQTSCHGFFSYHYSEHFSDRIDMIFPINIKNSLEI